MAYTRDKGREFWIDFDNQARFSSTFDDAYAKAYFDHGLSFDSIMNALRVSFARADHPAHFESVIRASRDGFRELASMQLTIMDAHLDDDAGIQSAFEDFGQGVLFDDRPSRPTGIKIHMMDGSPDTWVGYHRWHAFARAAVLLGADPRWLHINRCISLAWAIQTEANPTVDSPTNPGLTNVRLDALRQAWIALPPEKLDWAFVNNSTRAPLASLMPVWSAALGRYARMQQLLGVAATDGAPSHVDDAGVAHGRFWELSYSDFMALPPIYGHTLIAAPGPNRGDRSDLVKVLKGPLPDGIPRMPRFRPAMDPADIQFIQDWIDADCPEH
jgi:hypothetical protein